MDLAFVDDNRFEDNVRVGCNNEWGMFRPGDTCSCLLLNKRCVHGGTATPDPFRWTDPLADPRYAKTMDDFYSETRNDPYQAENQDHGKLIQKAIESAQISGVPARYCSRGLNNFSSRGTCTTSCDPSEDIMYDNADECAMASNVRTRTYMWNDNPMTRNIYPISWGMPEYMPRYVGKYV